MIVCYIPLIRLWYVQYSTISVDERDRNLTHLNSSTFRSFLFHSFASCQFACNLLGLSVPVYRRISIGTRRFHAIDSSLLVSGTRFGPSLGTSDTPDRFLRSDGTIGQHTSMAPFTYCTWAPRRVGACSLDMVGVERKDRSVPACRHKRVMRLGDMRFDPAEISTTMSEGIPTQYIQLLAVLIFRLRRKWSRTAKAHSINKYLYSPLMLRCESRCIKL
jgi:hypothetical protein